MECLKDWNEAALHFTGCYLLKKKKDKRRFALLHATVCLVQIYRTTVQFTTSQPCNKTSASQDCDKHSGNTKLPSDRTTKYQCYLNNKNEVIT